MLNLFGPHAGWLGLVDAFSVLAVLGLWLALRAADERGRVLWGAIGGVLAVFAVVGVFDRARGLMTELATYGFRIDGHRRALDIVLLLGGIAAGVSAAVYARRRAGDAEADARRYDLLALALAIAIPGVGGGLLAHGDFGPPGDVTIWALVLHFVAAATLAGALLVSLRDERADDRTAVAAFALLAVGFAVAQVWPRTFGDDRWSTLAAGFAAGLAAAVVLPLLASVLPVDREIAVLAALVAFGLLALSAVAAGRTAADYIGQQQGIGIGDDGGDVIPPFDSPSP
ncbi:MAG: hypothetical protein QOE45_2806 [Frankiaceae bacterium]|jgi:hypothetical protein|nr:hypothetical protein [Frankiaceae bacterium]